MKNKFLKVLHVLLLILSIVLFVSAITGAVLGCNHALILLVPAVASFSLFIAVPIKKYIATKKQQIIN